MDKPTSPGPPGETPAAETSTQRWLVNWVARLFRSEVGTPLVPAEYVASQGAEVRLIDVRDPQDFVGPLGYIPGSDWIPTERLESLPERLEPDAPLVIISGNGEKACEVVRMLENRGMHNVAALAGGVAQWLSLGFSTTRDPSILDLCDVLRPIETSAPGGADPNTLSIDEVRTHLGDPRSVRWIKLAALVLHGQLSCIDGRDDRGVIGTPGGDAGQFLLALAAVETVLGRPLDPDVIGSLLERRIDVLGGFYKHTDHFALASAAESMKGDPRLQAAVAEFGADPVEWRQFLRRPPLMLREAVLEHFCEPSAIGCGHIRLMYQHSDDYRVRQSLVTDFLRVFFRARWEGAFRAEYESLHGRHGEQAVLNTRIEGCLQPFTPIPLVSPSYFGSQMFVYHPQVSDYLLGLLVDFLLLQSDLIPEFNEGLRPRLLEEVKTLDGVHKTISLGHLAKGLPIYDVTFNASGQVRVEYAGKVG